MGLIGLTAEAAGNNRAFHNHVRLNHCHAGQINFDNTPIQHCFHLPLTIDAHRWVGGELLAFSPIECDPSNDSNEFLADSPNELILWGEITTYSGLGKPPALPHPTRYVENNVTGFITSSVYQKLSEPSFLVSPPKRSGQPRCVLRTFVYGLARGPHGEPTPLGG